METVKGLLEICSSAKELSRFGGASTSEHTMNNHRIKLERASYQCNSETESRNKGPKAAVKKTLILGCSSSRANLSCKKAKAAVLYSSSQVEELNERMRILEEETESMKQVLLESAEERKNLMNEIYQQFQMLARDFRLSHGNTSVNSQEDERSGTSLSDIVHQDLHKFIKYQL